MTTLSRRFVLLAAVGLLVATVARAQNPSAANSTVPPCITLVGSNGAVPDPAGTFTVTVMSNLNVPMPGLFVVINLSQCPDLHVCAAQLDPGLIVTCGIPEVRALTNGFGVATFTIQGGSNGAGNASTLLNGGAVYVLDNANVAWPLGAPTVTALDLDGGNGVAINDLAVWLVDFGTGLPYGRSDFDCTGSIGINDLALWLTNFGTGNSAQSCALPPAGWCP